jgi:hypothetical protein
MYGKLNYYLKPLFPSVDFCKNPGAICSSSFSGTLMWITGMFVWAELIQLHILYSDALDGYVLGEIEDQELMDIVSDRLDNGRNKEQRLLNFRTAMAAMEVE